jgi:hypothetical protein
MVKFPRRNEKDPYKRLGLTADSSFEEVQEARNFLVKEYMRDVDGCEQIDLAMDAILKEKLNTRKKSKGLKRKNLRQKKEEEDYTPPFVERIKSFLHTFAAMLVGWLIGSIIPVYIPLFPESFSPELILSLFSFLTLFVTCTFLK